MTNSNISSSLISIPRFVRYLIVLLIVLVGLFWLLTTTPVFGYLFHRVDTTEIGIEIKAGEFIEIKSPGLYNQPFSFFADIHNISIAGLSFSANDPAVLTSDLQRIGVTVSGTIFRPNASVMTETLWSTYRPLFTADNLLLTEVENKTRQAIKVCVGQRTFVDSAVGTQRNALGACIQEELVASTNMFGLTIRNVVIPDIQISEEARANLDALTDNRQQTLLAQQDAERKTAEAERDLAVRQGEIRADEGETQERLRQQAITAVLEEEAVSAQQARILAEIENERITAQGELELAQIRRDAARINAQAELANEIELASVMQTHPEYAAYRRSEQIATALSKANTMIIPENTNPLLMFNGGDSGNVAPTVNVTTESSE